MFEIDNAINKMEETNMKKKKIIQIKPKDIFEEIRDEFKSDVFDWLKKPKKYRPSDILKWKHNHFIDYLRTNISNTEIRNHPFDSEQFVRLEDRLTRLLCIYKEDNDAQCDNEFLKRYLDWWLMTYKPTLISQGIKVTMKMVTSESVVREFFRTGSWMPLKTSHACNRLQKPVTPSQTALHDFYRFGGAKKLLYEAGVVDSFFVLVTDEKLDPLAASREIGKALMTMDPPLLGHILNKTVKKAPYAVEKTFDVQTLVKKVLDKRNLVEFKDYRLDSLFEKE